MKYKWVGKRAIIEGGTIEVRDNRGIKKERDNSREGQIERGTQEVGIIFMCYRSTDNVGQDNWGRIKTIEKG
jgi:hypothetical protein